MGDPRPVGGFLPRRPPPPQVRAIADGFEQHLDEMVVRTVDAIQAEVPAYRTRDGALADTRRAAAHVYSAFFDTLRTNRMPNEALLRSLGTVGADRAAQGIPLGDLMQAFRISARTAASTLHEIVVERDLDRDAAVWAAEAIVMWIDVVSNLAAHDYSREQARILNEDAEARRSFLLDVLYGVVQGEAALERAAAVGWDPATTYWTATFGRPDGADAGASARDALAAAFELGFVTSAHGLTVVLVPVQTGDDEHETEGRALALARHLELTVGLAEPRSGISGVRRSFLEAAEAFEIAVALGERFVRHADAILDRILRREPELLAELVGRTVAPLAAYDAARGTELVETLATWFRVGESPTRAAEELHTHPQTIRYRLQRVNAITDLALETPDGRLHLLLGLRAARLLPSATGGSGAGPSDDLSR